MLVLAGVAVIVWVALGERTIDVLFKWLLAAVTALIALFSALRAGWTALRRQLLVSSPAGAALAMRTSDPMADLVERYTFLVRSTNTSVAILVTTLIVAAQNTSWNCSRASKPSSRANTRSRSLLCTS